MISKYKYINFQYNLQEVMEILPNIDGLPGRHKIQSLNYYQKKELEKVLKPKYTITSVLYFRLLSKSIGNVHIDTDLNSDNKQPKVALNIPILNGDIAIMYWYQQLPNTITKSFPGPTSKTSTPMLNHNDTICTNKTIMNRPTLVKIDDWHSISNISDNDNCEILSIRFLNK